ncbi:MAG: GNAT family N-acetyltransferase [Clostridia bacterium]|nr:GNAT family N-acetyltransferase [Clostridia bacterium]
MKIRKLAQEELHHWYETELERTFIEQERKPLEVILALMKREEYDVLGVFDTTKENALIGYATIAKHEGIGLLLLDYLGVTKAQRNKGLGGQILNLIRAHYGDMPIVLESELPVAEASVEENDIRARRINFYERNGFIPVYEMATCGLRWQALIGIEASHLDEKHIRDIMEAHKALYDDHRHDVVIPLGKNDQPPKSSWS